MTSETVNKALLRMLMSASKTINSLPFPGKTSPNLGDYVRKEIAAAACEEKEAIIETLSTKKYLRNTRSVASQNNKHIRKSVKKDVQEIASDIDPLLIQATVFAGNNFLYPATLDNIIVNEKDVGAIHSIKKAAQEGVVVFFPNHPTHLDSMIDVRVLYQQVPEAYPQFCAGYTVSGGISREFLKKMGAWFISRGAGKEHIGLQQLYIAYSLLAGQHSLVYLQGGRSYNGEFNKEGNGAGMMQAILELSKSMRQRGEKRKIYFVPITKSNSFITEDIEMMVCAEHDVKGGQTDLAGSTFSRLNQEHLITSKADTPIYYSFHSPLDAEGFIVDNINNRYAQHISNLMIDLIAHPRTIPPLPVISAAIRDLQRDKRNQSTNKYTLSEIANRTKLYAAVLLKDNANLSHHFDSDIRELVRKNVEEYFKRRRILIQTEDHEYILTENGLRSIISNSNMYIDLFPESLQERLGLKETELKIPDQITRPPLYH
ncbi:1-acyl-sn-glycerol-3-phosphate acyltransferase [Thermoproteota archaeon]